MHEHLQPWYDRWLADYKDTDLLYAGQPGNPSLPQVHFARELAEVVWQDVPWEKRKPASPRDDLKENAMVVGEHTSKSLRLPVFSFERPDLGIQIVARYNFYDWNVSVVSDTPFTTDLQGFNLDSMAYCFYQGFPKAFILGSYRKNQAQFSTWRVSDCELYTFVWLLMREVRGRRAR